MPEPRGPRQDRPLAEQHEEWMAHLRRHVVSRRSASGHPGGPGPGAAAAAAVAAAATIADGFIVNGRHLSYGDDPRTQMRVGAQLFNLNRYNAVPPPDVRVWLEYGRDRSYGHQVQAEIRELLTHVPVWDGKPGVLRAARTLNADQFFVHAHLTRLSPGTEYHYRFRYATRRETGATSDATFMTAPDEVTEPFTFTAFGDEGIPGPSLDQDPSLQPESSWFMWNNGGFEPSDPDDPANTGVNTTNSVIKQITRVRNLANGTPSRFHLQAGDLCYAQAKGDIQFIINPDGPNGSQPSAGNTPAPPAHSSGWGYYDPWIWTSWFPMIEHSAARIPWMFATGNHEAELFSAQVAADSATVDVYGPLGYGGLAKRLDLPATGPGQCPSVYSFSYGNVGIISLDANELCWEFQGLTGYSDGAQVRWLEERLAAWRGDPRIDFIIPFFHECAFATSSGHSSDGGVRSALAPLFARYQVDLVVQGHNHVYERTNPLLFDAATNSARSGKQAVSLSPDEPAEVEPATDGTTYLVVGTAGTERYSWSGGATDRNFAAGAGSGTTVPGDPAAKTGPWVTQRDFSKSYETVDWSQARYDDYGFIALDVTPAPRGRRTTMVLRFINEQGRELDRVVFSRTAGETTVPTARLPWAGRLAARAQVNALLTHSGTRDGGLMSPQPVIRMMDESDPETISAAFTAIGWHKPPALYRRYLAEQAEGRLLAFSAEWGGEFAGYVTLQWVSDYRPFAERRIPEICDLNVLPLYRRRGIGNALLDAAESAASARSQVVGLGVGLYTDYGAAQRIYVRRGYLPDGRGVMYRNQPVEPGTTIRLDDDAALMLTRLVG